MFTSGFITGLLTTKDRKQPKDPSMGMSVDSINFLTLENCKVIKKESKVNISIYMERYL